MDAATAAPMYPVAAAPAAIPVDLFVSKKHPGLPRGVLGFSDSSGNIVFRVNPSPRSSKSSPHNNEKRVVLDESGNPLITICYLGNGSWQGFRGADEGEEELLFKAQRMLNKFTRTELEVFIVGENSGESNPDLMVRGCVFQRSCSICRGDSIMAQTSLMYKLHQIFVGRSKFRLTIFPGSVDRAIVVALIVVFLDARK